MVDKKIIYTRLFNALFTKMTSYTYDYTIHNHSFFSSILMLCTYEGELIFDISSRTYDYNTIHNHSFLLSLLSY